MLKKEQVIFLRSRGVFLVGGCLESPDTAVSQRSHDMPILYFCSQSVKTLLSKIPIQVKAQIVRQASTKMFSDVTENF